VARGTGGASGWGTGGRLEFFREILDETGEGLFDRPAGREGGRGCAKSGAGWVGRAVEVIGKSAHGGNAQLCAQDGARFCVCAGAF